MIEITVREYLVNNLDVGVYMEQPEDPEREYVLLQLMDSGRTNQIDAATFFVDVRSDDLYRAAQLRDEVKEAMLGIISLDGISHVDLGGEQAQTDSANHLYKYNLTFNIYYYREEN